MTRRFRYAHGHRAIPHFHYHLEVRAKGTKHSFREIIEANAEEGWVVRHAKDDDGLFVIQDGEIKRERIEVDIEIVPNEGYPADWLVKNHIDDVTNGCIFDEDLTEDEQALVRRSPPGEKSS